MEVLGGGYENGDKYNVDNKNLTPLPYVFFNGIGNFVDNGSESQLVLGEKE